MSKRESSQITADLDTRIQTNQVFGDNDLDEWLLSQLNPKRGERILDAGCGTGNHLIKLAQRTAVDDSCMGFDLSEQSVQQAAEKARKAGVRIKFVVGNLDELDALGIANESFDTVTSNYALYYAENAAKTLSVLAQKIKASGRMAIMGPHADNNKQWFEFLRGFMTIPSSIERISGKFMEEVVVPFANEHFESVRVAEFVNNIRIPTYEDLKRYWVSNVYFKEEFDGGFEEHARRHFSNSSSFDFFKKGLLVVMNHVRNRKDAAR